MDDGVKQPEQQREPGQKHDHARDKSPVGLDGFGFLGSGGFESGHDAATTNRCSTLGGSGTIRVMEAPAPDYSEDGVDLSLIRAFLALTPAERLEFVERHVEDLLAIRELNARK